MTTSASSSGFLAHLVRARTFHVAATLALIGLAGAAWNLHLNAPPQVAVPPSAPLPSPNAYDELVRLGALNIEPADDVRQSILSYRATLPTAGRTPNPPKRPVTDAERQAALAKAEPVLTAMRTVLATDAYQVPIQRKLDTSDFKSLVLFRSLARTLAFESRMRELKGDYLGAANSALDAMQLGTTMPKGGLLVTELVGYAVEAIGARQLWGLIDRLDAEQSKSVAARLEAVEAGRPPFADALVEEKWSSTMQLSTMLQHMSTSDVMRQLNADTFGDTSSGDGVSSGEQTPEGQRETSSERMRNWRELLTHSKQQIVDDEMRMMDACIAEAQQPYTAPHAPIGQPHDPINRNYYTEVELYRNGLFNDTNARLNNSFLSLAFALRAFRLQNGAYPEALDQLKQSGLLHSIPDDPFAPTVGVPFHYHRVGTDQFLLYSVGPDGVDDGGRPVKVGVSSHYLLSMPTRMDKGDWVYGINTPKVSAQP